MPTSARPSCRSASRPATRRPEPTSSPTGVGRGCGGSCRWCWRTSGCSASRCSRRSSASRCRCRSRTRSARRSTHWAKTTGPSLEHFVGHHRGARGHPLRAHVHVAELPAEDGVPHRVRPAEHHVRAPEPHVVLVLRPRAVGSAHLPCQLRHPLGADVPRVRPEHPRAVQRRGPRVRRDAVDQRARSRSSRCRRCRSSTSSACACGSRCSPCRGSIQSRLADVATVVDENINGVRVVKSFAAEDVAAPAPHRRGDARGVGERQGRRHPGQVVAAAREPAPARPGDRAVLRRLPRHQRAGDGRGHRRLQRLRADAAAAVPPARDDHDDGPAGRRRRRNASTRCSTSNPTSSIAPARSTSSSASATCTSTTSSFELRQRHRAVLDALRPPPAPGRDRRPRRAHRQRQVDRGAPAGALLRRHRAARCASTATTCATSRCRACATTSAWCSTSRSSSRCRSATTSRTAGPTRRSTRSRAAASAAGADEFMQALPEGYDTVVGERGFTLSGGQRQRLAIARTLVVNPPILVLDDATSAIDVQIEQQIHEALRGLMADRTTLIIAHRLSTISLADRVAVVEGGRVIAEGTHAELLGLRAPVRRDPGPERRRRRARRRRRRPRASPPRSSTTWRVARARRRRRRDAGRRLMQRTARRDAGGGAQRATRRERTTRERQVPAPQERAN